jgi:hypothetical protein
VVYNYLSYAARFFPSLGALEPNSGLGRLWTSDQLVAEASTYTIQQKQETKIHVLGRIRTRKHSNRAAAEPGVTPHGHRHWNQQGTTLSTSNKVQVIKRADVIHDRINGMRNWYFCLCVYVCERERPKHVTIP